MYLTRGVYLFLPSRELWPARPYNIFSGAFPRAKPSQTQLAVAMPELLTKPPRISAYCVRL